MRIFIRQRLQINPDCPLIVKKLRRLQPVLFVAAGASAKTYSLVEHFAIKHWPFYTLSNNLTASGENQFLAHSHSNFFLVFTQQ